MKTGNTTVPSARDVAATLRPVNESAPALVIAWSAREPHRVGEVALLDVPGPWVLGRTSGDVAQLAFVKQLGVASPSCGALAAGPSNTWPTKPEWTSSSTNASSAAAS